MKHAFCVRLDGRITKHFTATITAKIIPIKLNILRKLRAAEQMVTCIGWSIARKQATLVNLVAETWHMFS